MDNNNNSFNPEIIPETPETDAAAIELPGAVIPEINTIEPINEIADTVIGETAAVEETATAAVEETVAAAETIEIPAKAEEAVAAQQPEAAVTEAFPDGCAPVVYAAANNSQPTDAPYYAAADNYTQRSEKGEGFALTAFILGLSSLLLTWNTPWCYVCIAVAIAGIIFATVAKKKGAVNSFQKSGLTMAIIGLILSLITSVSCAACDACATSFSEVASSEIFSELEDGNFDMGALQQFVEQYGDPEDVEEFNQALEQLQGFNYGE